LLVAPNLFALAVIFVAGFGSKCELWEGHRLVAKLEPERCEA
jgi:hypothetical protein